MNSPYFTYVLLGFVVILVIFMFFNSRRNRRRQEEMRAKIVPGVEIMTNFGLFGKLLSIDEASNVAEVETTPGVIVRVHRQTITKVVTPEEGGEAGAPRSVEEAMAIANREQAERDAQAASSKEQAAKEAKIDSEAPEYGERIDSSVEDPTGIVEPTKPTRRRTTKKTDD